MALFGKPTASERDRDELNTLQKQVLELRRELDSAQRRIDAVDLHARAIVEEAKRLINKFERRMDREEQSIAQSRQEAPRTTNGPKLAVGDAYPPIDPPGPRRNY